MAGTMNDGARPERWRERAVAFIAEIWAPFEGVGFVAARSAKTDRWREYPIPIDDREVALAEFFRTYTRGQYDLYFCPNGFSVFQRRAADALRTPYAWVDIDEADVDAFDPPPSILIRTSPGRHQGVWRFRDHLAPEKAEGYSRALAYNFGADRNGWSVTKYLRVPFTYNHKPQYDRPMVKLLHADFRPQGRRRLLTSDAGHRPVQTAPLEIETPQGIDPALVLQTYRLKLHPRVRALVRFKNVPVFEHDRSKCIFEIIAGLHEAGATLHEIGAVLWVNPFFVSKHGQDLDVLNAEMSRVTSKLGGK